MHKNKEQRIFIVDDDPWFGELLTYHLGLNPEYKVSRFETGRDCIANMPAKPDMTGDQLLKKLREIDPGIPIIIISAQMDVSVVINLFKLGVNDYILKDEAAQNLLWNSVIRIRETQSLRNQVETLKEELIPALSEEVEKMEPAAVI